MKRFYIFLITLLVTGTAWSQNTYSWIGANNASWGTATNWSPNRTTPAANDILQFNAGNTRTIANFPTTQTVGRIVISNNTNITIGSVAGLQTLTIGDGTVSAPIELDIQSGSSLTQANTFNELRLANNATASIAGTYTIQSAEGFFVNNTGVVATVTGTLDNQGLITGATATKLVFTGGTYIHSIDGGTIPTATWNATSTCDLSGVATVVPGGVTQNFGNFTWDCSGQSNDLVIGANISIQGNFTVANTGGNNLILTDNNTSRTLSIGGDYLQSGGTFRATNSGSGNVTMTVTGNYSQTGGQFRGNNNTGVCDMTVGGNFSLSGTGLCNLVSGNGNSTIAVTGDVAVTGTSELRLCEVVGQTGTLRVAGNFSPTGGTITEVNGTGSVIFNGSSVQTYSSGGTISNIVNFTVNAGSFLQMANLNTVVNGGGTFSLSSGATLGVTAAVGITSAGTNTGNIRTTNRTFSAGANYVYNGTGNQTTLGTGYPTNLTGSLTINNPGNTVTIGNARTIANGGSVFLTAGTFATSNTLTMASTSTITRSGGTMTGNLQGAGTYNVIFTGASKISGLELGGTGLSGITMNLTAGQVVTLNQARTIPGTLTLTSGILTTTAGATLTINTSGTATAGSNTSYVNGPLTKIGLAAFTFPVGKLAAGTGFVPIAIGASTGANTFTAEYMRGVPPNSTTIAGVTGINHISACDYWSLNRTAGTTAVSVTGYWNGNNPCSGLPYITNPTSTRIVHYNGTTTWDAASTTPGTGLAGAGSVTWTSTNLFSGTNNLFAFGSTVSNENPLPVMFADVKAYAKNSGVQIEWSNLTEREILYYSVERSANGTDFSMIEKYLPKSNLDDKASYTHFDAAPLAGVNYYRIKVYEKYGKIIYSKILRVEIGNVKAGFSLYPNPVTGNQLTVTLTGIKQGQYSLRVLNTAGQDVYHTKLTNLGSSISQMIVLPASIKPGVYTTVISGTDYSENKMFIVR